MSINLNKAVKDELVSTVKAGVSGRTKWKSLTRTLIENKWKYTDCISPKSAGSTANEDDFNDLKALIFANCYDAEEKKLAYVERADLDTLTKEQRTDRTNLRKRPNSIIGDIKDALERRQKPKKSVASRSKNVIAVEKVRSVISALTDNSEEFGDDVQIDDAIKHLNKVLVAFGCKI